MKQFLKNPQNRGTLGLIVMTLGMAVGVGVGGTLYASAYVSSLLQKE